MNCKRHLAMVLGLSLALGRAALAQDAAGGAAASNPLPLSGTALLREPLLQKRLRITPEQKAKMEAINRAADRTAARLASEEKARPEAGREQQENARKADSEILRLYLTARQRRDYEAIHAYFGLGYPQAIALADFKNLTSSQKTRLSAVAHQHLLAGANLFYFFEDATGGAEGPARPDNPAYAKRMKDLEFQAEAEVEKILTPKQWKRLREKLK